MNENVPAYRTGKVTILGKTSVNHAEWRELRQLFDQVRETSATAGDSLGEAGTAGADLRMVRELSARLDVLVGRAKQILK